MQTEPAAFYDNLAEQYHLIFENWSRSIERQAGILGPMIESLAGSAPLSILDCACGIGTQAIGLARRGHKVTASDISPAALARANREANQRGLTIKFSVADMRDLSSIEETGFEAVIAADNALPHLLGLGDLAEAVRQMAGKLKPSGVLLATLRDYDTLIQTRPASQPPAFYSDDRGRRIIHQIWDWEGDEYVLHFYITAESGTGWVAHHFASRYRALQRAEIFQAIEAAGFEDIQWREPAETSFYQPIVVARKRR